LTEPSLRPTVPSFSPNPSNKAIPKEAMMEEWSDGETHFSKAIGLVHPPWSLFVL
jgi:hypothetical protein